MAALGFMKAYMWREADRGANNKTADQEGQRIRLRKISKDTD